MIKITKKDLKDLSISLSAYYCGGNVYTHENIVYYLQHGEFDRIKEHYSKNNDLERLLNNLDQVYGINNFYNSNNNINHKYIINANQIAYSCGVYGNSGQLVEYKVINKQSNEVIYKFYTYYC